MLLLCIEEGFFTSTWSERLQLYSIASIRTEISVFKYLPNASLWCASWHRTCDFALHWTGIVRQKSASSMWGPWCRRCWTVACAVTSAWLRWQRRCDDDEAAPSRTTRNMTKTVVCVVNKRHFSNILSSTKNNLSSKLVLLLAWKLPSKFWTIWIYYPRPICHLATRFSNNSHIEFNDPTPRPISCVQDRKSGSTTRFGTRLYIIMRQQNVYQHHSLNSLKQFICLPVPFAYRLVQLINVRTYYFIT